MLISCIKVSHKNLYNYQINTISNNKMVYWYIIKLTKPMCTYNRSIFTLLTLWRQQSVIVLLELCTLLSVIGVLLEFNAWGGVSKAWSILGVREKEGLNIEETLGNGFLEGNWYVRFVSLWEGLILEGKVDNACVRSSLFDMERAFVVFNKDTNKAAFNYINLHRKGMWVKFEDLLLGEQDKVPRVLLRGVLLNIAWKEG